MPYLTETDLTNYATAPSSLTPLMKGIIHNASSLSELIGKDLDTINVRCNQGRTAMNYAKRKGDQMTYQTLKNLGGVDLDENSKIEQNLSDDGAAARSESNRKSQLPKGKCPCFQHPEMQKLLSSTDYIPGFLSNASFGIMIFLSRFCTHRSNNQETGNTSTSSGEIDNISQLGSSPSSDGDYCIPPEQARYSSDQDYYIPPKKARYSSDQDYYKCISPAQGSSPSSDEDYNLTQASASSSDGNYNLTQCSSPSSDGNYCIPPEQARYSSDQDYYISPTHGSFLSNDENYYLQELGSYPSSAENYNMQNFVNSTANLASLENASWSREQTVENDATPLMSNGTASSNFFAPQSHSYLGLSASTDIGSFPSDVSSISLGEAQFDWIESQRILSSMSTLNNLSTGFDFQNVVTPSSNFNAG